MRSALRAGAVSAVALVTLGTGWDAARAQDTTEIVLRADAVEVDLSGRVQTQLATTSCSDFPFEVDSPCATQSPAVDLFTRRVRLSATVKVNDFITAKVEPDFGDLDGVVLADAYGRLIFGEGAKVQVGQFKRPFDGFALVSSSRLLTVERDLDVAGVPGLRAASLAEFSSQFNLGLYDVGVMFLGETGDGRLAYRIGAFNGQGQADNRDVNGDKQLVGRLTYRLETAAGLPLSLSVAGALSDLAFQDVDDQPGSRVSSEYYGNLELFAELGDFSGGPHVQAGVILGDNPTQAPDGGDPLGPGDGGGLEADFATARAWQVIGAYRLAASDTPYIEAVEPVLRITRAEPNTDADDDEVWGLTPGVNLYFHGRNKLQINWDLVAFDGPTDPVNSFKAQFQVFF